MRGDKASLAFSELHAGAFARTAPFGDINTLMDSLIDEVETFVECGGNAQTIRNVTSNDRPMRSSNANGSTWFKRG